MKTSQKLSQEIEDNEGKRSELRKKLNALTAKEKLSEGDESAMDAMLTELSEKETRFQAALFLRKAALTVRGRRGSAGERPLRGP